MTKTERLFNILFNYKLYEPSEANAEPHSAVS